MGEIACVGVFSMLTIRPFGCTVFSFWIQYTSSWCKSERLFELTVSMIFSQAVIYEINSLMDNVADRRAWPACIIG